ncbi:hypothetical protein HYH03_001972 [Edaphochlamys debaryana]|uniref:tRNA (guanine(46)-N(7))-methyltransferase n=1 Tax=Edaphochlamys debaryana TaxID=47281 RepID=A0A835YD39_9CHLO|nr:hypothetical protein HYH03_001972 [Edaphochlamys debaryana]|eukprot:KAG2500401.1 hypothetical protein HYH03_001972 [Edaphochlamys debaryana]
MLRPQFSLHASTAGHEPRAATSKAPGPLGQLQLHARPRLATAVPTAGACGPREVRACSSGRKSAGAPPPPAWSVARYPADHEASPFAQLELQELWEGVGKTRVRQHVNPFRIEYQQAPPAPDWSTVFEDTSLPLAVDVGSGYGRFLLLLQRNNPERRSNYLGIEIRRALVDRSNAWSSRLGVGGTVRYEFGNATVGLRALLEAYPGPVTDVFIQFPDPHFKRRHHKRRVVQPQLVAAVRDVLQPGGRVLLQSDVEEVAVHMRNMFEKHAFDAFELAPQHDPSTPGAVFFSTPPAASSPSAAAEAQHAPSGAEAAEGLRDSHAGSGSGPAAAGHGGGAIDYKAAAAGAARHAVAAAAAAQAAVRQAEAEASVSASGTDSEQDVQSTREEDEEEMGAGGGMSDEEGGSASGRDEDDDIATMDSVWARSGWLVTNPVGTPTEREHYVQQQGLPVYRVMLVRKA